MRRARWASSARRALPHARRRACAGLGDTHVSPQIPAGTPGADSARQRRTLHRESGQTSRSVEQWIAEIEDPAKRVDPGRVAHLSGLRMVSGSRVTPPRVVAGLVRGFRSARNFRRACHRFRCASGVGTSRVA